MVLLVHHDPGFTVSDQSGPSRRSPVPATRATVQPANTKVLSTNRCGLERLQQHFDAVVVAAEPESYFRSGGTYLNFATQKTRLYCCNPWYPDT